MILNDILKRVHNNATDEIIRRGKKIFHTSGVSIISKDILAERITFNVRHDIFSANYRVVVSNYITTEKLNTRCNCSYNRGTVCRHEAAALFQLNELVKTGYFEDVDLEFNQEHTLVRMRKIDDRQLKIYTSGEIYTKALALSKRSTAFNITEAADDVVKAVVKEGRVKYDVVLAQNEDRYFETSCTCDEDGYPLCVHKAALFLKLLHENGENYFATLRNWDKVKEKLLALYGFTLEDNLKGKFEFVFLDGNLSMRRLDPSLKKLTDPTHPNNIKKLEAKQDNLIPEGGDVMLVMDANAEMYPHIKWYMASAVFEGGEATTNPRAVDMQTVVESITVSDLSKQIARIIPRMKHEEMVKAIKRDTPFGDFVDSLDKDLKKEPNATLFRQVWDYQWPKVSKLLEQYHSYDQVYYLPKGKSLKCSQLKKVAFTDNFFTLGVFINKVSKKKNADIAILVKLMIDDEPLNVEEYTLVSRSVLIYQEKMFVAQNVNIIELIREYDLDKKTVIPADEWSEYLENKILKLDNKVQVTFDTSLQKVHENLEPTYAVQVKELEGKFVFIPTFYYKNVGIKWLEYGPAIVPDNGKVTIYERNEASEQSFLNLLRYLHENMQERRKLHGFTLDSKDALKKGWYFDFIELMKSKGVVLTGYDQLKQMKINPNKPVVSNIHMTSGIDWFESEIEIAFGDQTVTVAEVKKALAKNSPTVNLSDGSQGVITDEFLEEFGLMIKLGQVEGNKIKISKIHFAALDGVEALKDNEEVYQEVEEKKMKLLNFDFEEEQKEAAPENLNAELRPYQLEGFRWMTFLSETNWGGILADDMGLGKTIQTLTILLRHFNLNKKAKFLVACPTTLIYNWESECKNFTPDMSLHIYHGPNRKRAKDAFHDANLIVTTFGTLRSDINFFSSIEWDYVVLDESQAIKNPVSLIAKSVMKLQAKNKLALSGTPIQNNTFDLYAQMNFLNPGMLGSIEFFKNEFATPIDKMQDEVAKSHLKKLIYPFLLRRTKEQVATDLPPKVETVLYCEMGSKQKKVYEAYRNKFRTQILGAIDDVGIERSQMSILTGLMKLRQICDSPAILNEAEQFDNHSIKLDELTREISENMGNHKSLVFSQFLGMLDLIRKELEKRGIPYVYFDGSTTSTERERAIRQFQDEDKCRVFLISLKAGGVGLNLTAADYVYIVDPWWNPAVEQQAIDRTHRIGQSKNIFAYRMICKNTIEEKILLLQERKKSLAKDLISDDGAFLKKLKREDIEYLLS